MHAPLPPDESERLEALHDLGILDTPAEPDFDDIVDLAAAACGAPMSLVSLVDADRQWFKAKHGLGADETARDTSFCAHAILGRDLMVVPDASADRRFADNPYVRGDPRIRFYAGAPLITSDGFALGTLCVADATARHLTIAQLRALRALARQVTAQLELRRYAGTLARAVEAERQLPGLITGDLRGPLDELRTCFEVLRDTDSCPPEIAARIGELSHGHAAALLRLTDALVRVVKPGTGLPALQMREVDLSFLVQRAAESVRPIAEVKSIPITVRTGGPVTALVDPVRFDQALSHLLFTAVKFTGTGGQVHIVLEDAVLHIRNSGGAEHPGLFEHFCHGASVQSLDGPPGADFGLAVAKAILDAHHATVAISDESAAGTSLHIAFPPA